MKAYERFLKYVTVWTSSDEDSSNYQKTAGSGKSSR